MKRVVMCLIALAGVSCREPTSVSPQLRATYALVRVNGSYLPTVVAEGGGQRYTLFADTLQFELDGRVRRTQVVRWVSTDMAPGDTTYTQRMTLPYSIDGKSLVMGYTTPCPPNANCIGFDSAVIDEETVTMVARMFWPGEPRFVFRRVD
jgi:hypothetical protein